jgi:hypothetical protein
MCISTNSLRSSVNEQRWIEGNLESWEKIMLADVDGILANHSKRKSAETIRLGETLAEIFSNTSENLYSPFTLQQCILFTSGLQL